jgi:hypothetical protein
MALPVDLSSLITNVGPPAGPFKVGSSFYIVGRDNVTNTDLVVIEASDPTILGSGTGWEEQDTVNRPSAANLIDTLAAVVDGTTIHIITQFLSVGAWYAEYHTFNTSTNAWAITNETISSGASSRADTSIPAIGVRSDGNIAVLYQGQVEGNMGTDYGRAYLAERLSGTWTADIRVDNLGKVSFNLDMAGGIMADQTNDRFHAGFFEQPGTDLFVSTFPGDYDTNAWTNGQQGASADTSINPSANTFNAVCKWIAFTDTTRKVRASYSDNGTLLSIIGFDDGATPSPSAVATSIEDGGIVGASQGAALAVDGTTQHALFGRSTDSTIVYHDETGAGNDTWGTDATELDSANSVFVSNANVYDRSGKKLAYIYADNNLRYYGERSLVAGPSPQNLTGAVASDPWTASPVGALAAGPVNLSGSVAADPWTASPVGSLLSSANLVGSAAADPWIAVDGALAAGNAPLVGSAAADPWIAVDGALAAGPVNLSGLTASDPWLPTDGALAAGNVPLIGSIASDPWLPTDGALAAGNAPLSGLVAADLWVATDGVVAVAAGAQNLIGSVAADPWTASPVGSLLATALLVGEGASDPWTASPAGSLLAGNTNLSGLVASDPWITSPVGAASPGNANLSGSVASDPWLPTDGALAAGNVNLSGSVAADPWLPANGALAAGNAPLSGSIAADPWTASPVGVIVAEGGSQTLVGSITADPWLATDGALSGGNAPLIGSITADPWLATDGALSGGNAPLVGDVAADLWAATDGALAGGNAPLVGVIAADPWTASPVGVIVAASGAQNLVGSVAADPWTASPVGVMIGGAAPLLGEVSGATWSVTDGTAAPGNMDLSGVIAADPWTASPAGLVLPGGVVLVSNIVVDPWLATDGALAGTGNANLSGDVVSDPWVATVGLTLNPPLITITPEYFLVGVWDPTQQRVGNWIPTDQRTGEWL